MTLINDLDITGVQETKTDDIDLIDIHGYRIFFKNRARASRVKSGGIALIARESMVLI